jgi:hypothetical protein
MQVKKARTLTCTTTTTCTCLLRIGDRTRDEVFTPLCTGERMGEIELVREVNTFVLWTGEEPAALPVLEIPCLNPGLAVRQICPTPLPDLRIPGAPLPVPGPLSLLAMSDAMSLRRSRVTPEAATLASLSVRLTAND